MNTTTMNPTSVIHLADYLNAVKYAIQDNFAVECWVVCEIRAMHSKSGHYYLELADKDEQGAISASCRATIWRSYAQTLLTKFKKQAGRTLTADLSVLLKGKATFHPKYGFSFNIVDIDPNYTLGQLAQDYQAMQAKLDTLGLLHLNKSRAMPFDIQTVAVIAPEQAAGLGDFKAEADRLQRAGVCQFDYYYATFQGNTAPAQLRHVLQSIKDLWADGQPPDLVVMIRGGGAVGDLAYLNDYELAAMVAEMPLPVWVGIGHERDRVILDDVAHHSFDTPSKVIWGIETVLVKRWQTVAYYAHMVAKLSKNHLKQHQINCQTRQQQLKFGAKNRLHQYKSELAQQKIQLKTSAWASFYQQKNTCQHYFTAHKMAYQHSQRASEQLNYWQAVVQWFDPAAVLNKGYAIVKKDGQTTNAQSLNLDDTIYIQFADGTVIAKVQHISKDEKI